MVYIIYDSRQIIASRSGDDNMLRACIDMSLSLRLAGVEAGALENDVNSKLSPRKVLRISFLVDRDLLAVYRDGILAEGNLIAELVSALCAVILQKMSKHLRAGKIVDRDNIKSLCPKHLSESKTTDAAKTVNRNFYCHNSNSS